MPSHGILVEHRVDRGSTHHVRRDHRQQSRRPEPADGPHAAGVYFVHGRQVWVSPQVNSSGGHETRVLERTRGNHQFYP